VEATGIAPVTRCLQSSIATMEHAPPIKNLKWHVTLVLPQAPQVLETRVHKLVRDVQLKQLKRRAGDFE